MRDDIRTLHEFYPELESYHAVHYDFAYRLVPQYIHGNSRDFFRAAFRPINAAGQPTNLDFVIRTLWVIFEVSRKLVTPESIDVNNPKAVRHLVSDLTMSLEKVANNPALLIRMPPPMQQPDAFFLVLVLLGTDGREMGEWPESVTARVFALEAMSGPQLDRVGPVCEWKKDGSHANFHHHPLQPKGDILLHYLEMILEEGIEPPVTSKPRSGDLDLRVEGQPVDTEAVRKAKAAKDAQASPPQKPKPRLDASRRFEEIYPDAGKRAQAHHEFTNQHLPKYVHGHPRELFWAMFRDDEDGKPTEPSTVIRLVWVQFAYSIKFYAPDQGTDAQPILYLPSDLDMQLIKLKKHAALVIKMPAPSQKGQALAVLVVLETTEPPSKWPDGVKARVFTLEMDAKDPLEAIVSEWKSDGSQAKYGSVESPPLEKFVEAVAGLLK